MKHTIRIVGRVAGVAIIAALLAVLGYNVWLKSAKPDNHLLDLEDIRHAVTIEKLHDYYRKEFIGQPAPLFGLSRVPEPDLDDPEFPEAPGITGWDLFEPTTNDAPTVYRATSLHLVSLLEHDQPLVYLDKSGESVRPLTSFETAALDELRSRVGEGDYDSGVVVSADKTHAMGAVVSQRSCLKCHDGHEDGRPVLLGAFVYRIESKPLDTSGKSLGGWQLEENQDGGLDTGAEYVKQPRQPASSGQLQGVVVPPERDTRNP